jgi:hypothetical protein
MKNIDIVTIISIDYYPALIAKFKKNILRVYTRENLLAQNDKSFFA